MSLDVAGVLAKLQSHAKSTGHFEQVLLHEPKSAPGQGVTLCMRLGPIFPASSGLDNVSMVMVVLQRLYVPFLQSPEDAIDSGLWAAIDPVIQSYATDFTLNGAARAIDFFGEHGVPFRAEPGYLTQDGTVFRVIELDVPVIVNDCYQEGE